MVATAARGEPRIVLSRLLLLATVFVSTIGLAPPTAFAQTRIDLSYDSMMDMVRPEQRPRIIVHHNLQIELSGHGVAENRDRNARQYSDRNAMVQELGGTEQSGTYASWRVESGTRLVRTQRDPQSTRLMTVILTSPTTCRLGSCPSRRCKSERSLRWPWVRRPLVEVWPDRRQSAAV